MISAFVGKPGVGKTISMAIAAIIFAMKGKKIYSNFDIFLPSSRQPLSSLIVSRQDLENATGGMVFLDEIAKWLDARESFSDDNAFSTGVLQKGRKRGNNLCFSAQDFWMVDIRLRINTDYVFIPEIFYRIFPGEETKIVQNFFDPVDTTPLLKFAWIRLYQVAGAVYQKEKYIHNEDIISIYEFPMYPFVNYYDTREEIQDLARSEVEKGINDEHAHARLCEIHFELDEPIKVNPESGRGMDSLDFEFILHEKLNMVDSTTLHETDGRFYLDFTKKSPIEAYFYDTEKKKSSIMYLSFYYPKTSTQMYLLPIDSILDHTSTKMRVNDALLAKCIKVKTPDQPILALNFLEPIIEIVKPTIIIQPKLLTLQDHHNDFRAKKLAILSRYGF